MGSEYMNKEQMINWLIDAIDTEIEKPEDEADMALVNEYSALLGELTGDTCTLSEQELKKRCRAITGKPAKTSVSRKKVRWIAAAAACAAVFVVMSGCGYLPSISSIIGSIINLSFGETVELDTVKYTFLGTGKTYSSISELITSENLNISIPELPEGIKVTNVVKSDDSKIIFIIFDDTTLSIQVYYDTPIEELCNKQNALKHTINEHTTYILQNADMSYTSYTIYENFIYCINYIQEDTLLKMLSSIG